MEEIDISQLLNYFRSKIVYIVFAMSLAFCLASIYVNRFRVPEYSSETTILLNQSNSNSTISSSDISLNNSLVPTYSEIIKSKRVLSQVIDILDLDLEVTDLAGKVNVGEVSGTSIISIKVTDADADSAANIANTIADVFTKEIIEIYNIENISVIDSAEPAKTSSSTSALKIIGIATVGGAIVALGIIFVAFYFDTTIKSEEDIERATGLPVIGLVPASREKLKASEHRKYYDNLSKHKNEVVAVQPEVRKIEAKYVDTSKEIGISETKSKTTRSASEEYKFDTGELHTVKRTRKKITKK